MYMHIIVVNLCFRKSTEEVQDTPQTMEIGTYVRTYISMHICMYVCIYVCMHIHVYVSGHIYVPYSL